MTLPNLHNALIGWEQDIILVKTTFNEVDIGQIEEIEEMTPFKGVVQPLKPYSISLKPIELRAFEWIMIHVGDNIPVILKNGDKIKWGAKYYKIMEVLNWSNFTLQTQQSPIINPQSYGYIEYHACEVNINENI